MLRATWWMVLGLRLSLAGMAGAAEPEKKPLPAWEQGREPDEVVTFKTTPQGPLKLDIYRPEGWQAQDRRPAVVFWFGGGFNKGSTTAFSRQSTYLTTRSLVCICAEYRLKSKHDTGIDKCVEDARSGMRWIKSHASELGIDPEKIVASGGSAGGTLALNLALADGPNAPEDDLKISTRPQALVLFNPAQGSIIATFAERVQGSAEEKKRLLEQLSAIDRPQEKEPPMVMFFGTDDKLLELSREFCKQATKMGARCEIWTAAGQRHAFFNRRPWYAATLRQADLFLGSLGYVQGEPTIPLDTSAVLMPDLPADEAASGVSSAGK